MVKVHKGRADWMEDLDHETINVGPTEPAPGAFETKEVTKGAVTPAMAIQKPRFDVKQAQPHVDTTEPGIGDVAPGATTMTNNEPRFKPDKVELPGYEPDPGAFDKAADGPPSRRFQPEGLGGANRSQGWQFGLGQKHGGGALENAVAYNNAHQPIGHIYGEGAFDVAMARPDHSHNQDTKPRFVTKPAGPESYSSCMQDTAFGKASSGASPMQRDNKPRFAKSGVANLNGDPGVHQ